MNEERTSRRRFLGTAAGATGVALAAVAWPANTAAAAVPDGGRPAANPITTRGYVAGKFSLELEGINAGWVHSVEGGHATSDVVTEKLGADNIAHKHLANVKYEDVSLSVGTGMSKAFYDWIAASWTSQFIRKDGKVSRTDFAGNLVRTMDFYDALITETGLPALDASSKDAALIDVTFSPEMTKLNRKVSGTLQAAASKQQKLWIASNFRLTIAGLDCTRVNKIEALVVKQKLVEDPIGEERDYQREPASIEFPNLVVTLAESSAESWYQWHEDFVIKGNNGQGNEKNGTLEYLSPNLSEALFTVEFNNLGIFKIASEDAESAADKLGRVKVQMYCEQMVFRYSAGVIA